MQKRPRPAFDSLVLAAVAAELRAFAGGRALRVHQPARDEVRITLRARRTAALLCAIDPARARVHLTGEGGRTPEPGPFVQLLRARVEGARLAAVEQPPFDRVLRLVWEGVGETVVLVAEIMGRNSNLIAVRGGVVLGSLRRTGPSAGRPVIPGRPYAPPPESRPKPGLGVDELAVALGGRAPLWDALALGVQGLSGPLGWEAAARAGLDPQGPAPGNEDELRRLAGALTDLVALRERDAYEPVLYVERGEARAFGAIPLACFADLQAVPAPMSEALDRWYGARPAPAGGDTERAGLVAAVRERLRRTTRALDEARRDLAGTAEAPRLRGMGELLLAYASQIPAGSSAARLPGFDGREVEIPLDPTLSPVQNAQRLFRRYAKLQSAAEALPPRVEHLEREAAYLEETLLHVEQAEPDDLPALRRELQEAGLLRRQRGGAPVKAVSGPRRYTTSDGFAVVVGRSSAENDRVTFEVASPSDLWLHARGVPGSHVILRVAGREPSERAIEEAAAIAAWFSAARQSGRVAVDVTERRFVRKPKGSPPGFVTYERERTVYVAPVEPGTRDSGLGTRDR